MIAATDIADLLVRRGVPFRQSHGIVAGLVRESRSSSGRALGADARGARAPLRACSTTSTTRCSPRARGWSPRSPRAAPRWTACASSSLTRARSSTFSLRDAAATAPSARLVRTRAGRSRSRATSSAARRPTARPAAVIVETEAYHESEPACHAYVGLTAAPAVAVRPPGQRLRLPLLRHPRADQRGLRARGRRRGGADPRARAARRARRHARASRLGASEDLCSGPGKLTPGARHRARAQRHRLLGGPDRSSGRAAGSASDAGDRRRARGSGSPRRSSCRGASAWPARRHVSRPWPPGLRTRPELQGWALTRLTARRATAAGAARPRRRGARRPAAAAGACGGGLGRGAAVLGAGVARLGGAVCLSARARVGGRRLVVGAGVGVSGPAPPGRRSARGRRRSAAVAVRLALLLADRGLGDALGPDRPRRPACRAKACQIAAGKVPPATGSPPKLTRWLHRLQRVGDSRPTRRPCSAASSRRTRRRRSSRSSRSCRRRGSWAERARAWPCRT